MGRILRAEDVEAAIKGGTVFAARGGGWADHGRMLGTAAVNAGEPELVAMDEVPELTLTNDTSTGVMRYADAGYEESLNEAARTGIRHFRLLAHERAE